MLATPWVGFGCAHAPSPEHRTHVASENTEGVGISSAVGGSGGRDCQSEHEECFRRCWQKSRPTYPHKHDEWYYKRCTTDCRRAYNDCVDEQEETRDDEKPLEFSTAPQAIEWLENNKAKVVMGSIVIIAGVAFIITTGGTGALILAPLAL